MSSLPETAAGACLDVTRVHMRFRATRPGRLPMWMGSTWRGAFGRALKSLACVTGLPECRTCPMFSRCDHARIFETPPDPAAGKMRRYTAAPHPYALLPDPGGTLRAGQILALELRLFGRAGRDWRLVTDALNRAAQSGLGPERMRLEPAGPVRPETITWSTPALAHEPVPERLEIHLVTPLRLRLGGKLVGVDNLTFGGFFSVMLRRISMLCTFHQQAFEADFRALTRRARELQWRDLDLQLVRRVRHSSRQGRKIDLSGLTGRVALDGEQAEPFWPWLRLGEQTLVGKGTVMGLGKFEIA